MVAAPVSRFCSSQCCFPCGCPAVGSLRPGWGPLPRESPGLGDCARPPQGCSLSTSCPRIRLNPFSWSLFLIASVYTSPPISPENNKNIDKNNGKDGNYPASQPSRHRLSEQQIKLVLWGSSHCYNSQTKVYSHRKIKATFYLSPCREEIWSLCSPCVWSWCALCGFTHGVL